MSSAQEIVDKVDQLHLEREFVKISELLVEGNKQYPDNVEIMWRLARSYFDKNEEVTDKAEKKKLLDQALELTNKAATVDPNHWAVHKWLAILISALGDHVSSKEKIANAFKIKEHADKANELKPNDATTLHLIGRWCFSIASIGWVERTAASALFGTPPTSTFQEALKYFLEAYSADPTNIRNALFTGDTYAALKDNTKAKEFYKIAAAIEPKSEFDKNLVKEAQNKAK
ncbi:hypothetical protein RB653_004495 [Dictyostelium firmibasis]|uniref:Regulator of microtubule dynamics protein 1 n=1 Tax=Dictyostelium firmibasis TaxID=79012 RepID=A0AAN7YY85_9MYCE